MCAASMFRQASDKEADSAVVLDIARDGREAGQLRLSLAPNQRCVFGRQPGSCDVVLEHLSISRQHAHLSMDLNGRCFVTDMGSGDCWLPSLYSDLVMHLIVASLTRWLALCCSTATRQQYL